MTMLCHKDLFLVRHREAPDVPFQVFKKDTLTHDTEAKPFKSDGGARDHFRWTPTDESFPSDTINGNRWMRACPMFSDGELIYTLVQYRETSFTSPLVKVTLETYEVDDDSRRVTRISEVNLYKETTAEHFKGTKKQFD